MTLYTPSERILADAGGNIEAALTILEAAFQDHNPIDERIALALVGIGHALIAHTLVSIDEIDVPDFLAKYRPTTPIEE